MASSFQNPHYTGADNSSLFPAIVTEVVVSIVLTTTFTAARLAAQKSVSKFDFEDYFSLSAWALCTAYSAIILAQGVVGAGQHIWKVPLSSSIKIAKLSWAIELSYCLACWVAKAALIFQLRRTFAPYKKGSISLACLVLVWAYGAFCFSAFVAKLVECIPTERIWDPSIKTGHCINNSAVLISEGIVNVLSDVAILVIPIWAILHLKIGLKKKLGILAVFATGLLAIASSICRLVWTFPVIHDEDTTYLIAPLAMWSLAEMSSIILCTCFPLMPRFVRMMVHERRTSQVPPTRRISKYILNDSKNSTRNRTQVGFLSFLRSENAMDASNTGENEVVQQQNNNGFSKEVLDGASTHEGSEPRTSMTLSQGSSSVVDEPAVKSENYITVHREFQVQHGVDAGQCDVEKQMYRDPPE